MENSMDVTRKIYDSLAPLMNEILDVRYLDLEEELEKCKKLLAISKQEKYVYGEAFALTYMGDYYIAKNNGSLANEYLKQAEELCSKNKYNELLMNVYIFYGVYYDMMQDSSMSLNFTLDALELASEFDNGFRKSVINNNIANVFENFGDMEAAKAYYLKALLCLENVDITTKNTSHYALVIANLIHLSCHFNEIEQAEIYLEMFDHMDLNVNGNMGQFKVCKCHLAFAKKDIDELHEYIDDLIENLRLDMGWGFQFFEMLVHAAEYSLEYKDQIYAHKILLILNQLSEEGELGNKIRTQEYWVQYYEMFGTQEQQGWAYKRYYELKQLIDIVNKKTMATGIHAKIGLREAKKQQQKMLIEKERLENETQQDSLTQLHNRRSFDEYLKDVFLDTKVHSLGFAMIDVDYFKQYNDTYGHGKGDDTLRAVAQSMVNAAGGNENIYNIRYGGDEFLTVYLNCSNSEMEMLLKNIVTEINTTNISHETSMCSEKVTLSIGFTVEQGSEKEPYNIKSILEKADKALYKAKERGRNNIYESKSNETNFS